MNDAKYEDLVSFYFARVLASRTGVPLISAATALGDVIVTEMRSSKENLRAVNLPMGRMILGREYPRTVELIFYTERIRFSESDRWKKNGVREEDILAWWDLGGVLHGCYIAFDNFFNISQALGAMRNKHDSDSLEDLADYSQWWLAKNFPLYGPADSDDGTEDGRLPHELRARVETWILRARRESPRNFALAVEQFSSFNALSRFMIRQGVM